MIVGFDTLKKQTVNGDECLAGGDIEIDVPRGATVNVKNSESETTIEFGGESDASKMSAAEFICTTSNSGVDATTYEGDVTVENSGGAITFVQHDGQHRRFRSRADGNRRRFQSQNQQRRDLSAKHRTSANGINSQFGLDEVYRRISDGRTISFRHAKRFDYAGDSRKFFVQNQCFLRFRRVRFGTCHCKISSKAHLPESAKSDRFDGRRRSERQSDNLQRRDSNQEKMRGRKMRAERMLLFLIS